MAVTRFLQLQEPGGLPGEHLVGHPFERLAEHYEPAGCLVARAEMQVAEPALAASVPPLGRQDHEIEGSYRFDLEPVPPALSGLVRRVERLGHDALVALVQRLPEERSGSLGGTGDEAAHDQLRRGRPIQQRDPVAVGPVDQAGSVEEEQVEQHQGERERFPDPLHPQPAAEPPHCGLEGMRGAVRTQRDGLTLEDELRGRERQRTLHQLRHGRGHLVEPPRIDPDLVPPAVNLHPRAVQLELQPALAQLGDRLGLALGGAGQHRLHRLEEPDGEGSQRGGPTGERRAGHGGQLTRHHCRAAELAAREPGRLGDRLEHQSLQGTLTQLAHQETAQKALLGLSKPEEQLVEETLTPGRRPGSARLHDAAQGLVHLGQADARRLGRRAGQRGLDRGPAYAELGLKHRSREVRHSDLQLLSREGP